MINARTIQCTIHLDPDEICDIRTLAEIIGQNYAGVIKVTEEDESVIWDSTTQSWVIR